MIQFESFVLDNGLRVFVHEDHSVQIAVMNLLYDVGARDEESTRTGFAHLFEHLMFGGSVHIPNYDEPLQKAGGENNAFTSNDITNYYLTVPSANLETGFWLESDRMLGLSFDPKVLDVQRKVVVEEFKQRYLNQPYGDVWLKLRPLAYQMHPYQWATIGKEPAHVEQATMEDVRTFFYSHYLPNNAILVVAGDVTLRQVRELSEKWFGPIPSRPVKPRSLPKEPRQTEKRMLSVEASVPANALYKVYPMPARLHFDYHASDIISDILGRGHSSRLYNRLVKEREVFTSVSSYITGSIDPGLLVFSGRAAEGVDLKEAEKFLDEVVYEFALKGPKEEEVEKIRNQAETTLAFSEVEVMNRAMNLAYAALLGNPGMVNEEIEQIRKITGEDIRRVAGDLLKEEQSSVLYYNRKN
ncbi:MAG: M16 family metallopeptidase [Cyclobacteriaceae bacterium]|jgi:zinc protease